MEENNKLRIAIIGLGAVTRNIHLPAYASLAEKLTVVAGCDTDGETVRSAREKMKLPEVFTDAREMVEKPRLILPPFARRRLFTSNKL